MVAADDDGCRDFSFGDELVEEQPGFVAFAVA